MCVWGVCLGLLRVLSGNKSINPKLNITILKYLFQKKKVWQSFYHGIKEYIVLTGVFYKRNWQDDILFYMCTHRVCLNPGA